MVFKFQKQGNRKINPNTLLFVFSFLVHSQTVKWLKVGGMNTIFTFS